MPTPIDLLMDPLSLIIIGMYVLLFVYEKLFPRHKHLPNIKYAGLRGVVGFAVFFYLSSYLPLFTDAFLSSHQLWDLSGLPFGLQILIGLLSYQLLLYVWHRSMHRKIVMQL